ncbi:MAG: HNH endonuclease signature motif containing protein [Chloroflexota bacterium]
MSNSYIPVALRRLVYERANGRCEYCLIAEATFWLKHQVDHIIAEQHGGSTTASNLALACIDCNRDKGPNIASIDWETGKVVPLFNPRTQSWDDHFALFRAEIQPLTPTGQATARLLSFNSRERLIIRRELILAGLYP